MNPTNTAPKIAMGILFCGFLTSPANIKPFWKPVNAKAIPPADKAENISIQLDLFVKSSVMFCHVEEVCNKATIAIDGKRNFRMLAYLLHSAKNLMP